jgi:uncharacterized protein (DUF1778 family)
VKRKQRKVRVRASIYQLLEEAARREGRSESEILKAALLEQARE